MRGMLQGPASIKIGDDDAKLQRIYVRYGAGGRPAAVRVRRASLGHGALSLRLIAQTLSRTGRGWGGLRITRPAWIRAITASAIPVRNGEGAGDSTSPGTGEVASLSEPERALSLGRLRSDGQSARV